MNDLYKAALEETTGYPDAPRCQYFQCDQLARAVVGTITQFNFRARLLCERHADEEFDALARFRTQRGITASVTPSGYTVVADLR